MKLTHASNYALHAVAHMAREKGGKPVACHVIAAARGIPERFLLKVLKPLVSARVLDSIRGPHGGYRLRKPLDDVSMLDIVEAVDGPIRGESPFADRRNAALNEKLEEICRGSAEAARERLGRVRISDLVAGKKRAGKAKPAAG
jgi:Rrf2 family protein